MLRIPSIFFLLILSVTFFSSNAFAQARAKSEDKMVGTTFKALAKVFIATTNLEKLKKINIERLSKMSDEKFKKRYGEAYQVLQGLPDSLKHHYGITEQMTKERAISNIKSLDKKKIYEMMDAIPDAMIAEEFRKALQQKNEDEHQKPPSMNMTQRVNEIWQGIIGNIRP